MKNYSIYSVFFAVLCSVTFAAAAQDNRLVILHTNDTHSQIEEIRTGKGAGTGGIHRRAEYFAQVREANRDVLVLDAGDYSQGTPYFTVFKGDLEVELMNSLGYDVAALGNHEFDNGVAELARRLSKAKFVTVCANYDFTGTPLENIVKPYTIVYKAGKKIGIFGLVANLGSLVSKQNLEGMVFMDTFDVADKWADYLKNEEKCDLVIALTHVGYSGYPNQVSDIALAEKSENIDIIVGGHSHTFLKSGKVCKNRKGRDVLILHAGAQGEYVGRLDIDFD